MTASPLTRRRLLAAALAAPFVLPGRARAVGGPVTIGLALALSGPYAEEGQEQRQALDLAIDHLNGGGCGGMLATLAPSALAGAGLLGHRVARVLADTGTDAALARQAARRMISRDGVAMIVGGSSSGTAVAIQGLAAEAGVIFMAGVAHADALTGRDRSAHGFRHFLNARLSALALAPALADLHGPDRHAAHLAVDNPWGRSQHRAMRAATEAAGWRTGRSVTVAPTLGDLFAPLTRAADEGAEVLVLNLYGGQLLSGLLAADKAGLRDRGIAVVTPLHSDLVARRAGAAAAGVVGTQNWHPDLETQLGSRYAGTDAFVRAYRTRHGRRPGQSAQTCYAQTLLYADAVARAGSAHPCAVIEALEDHAFCGLGTGPSLYRAADHQCLKDVAIVRGTGEAGVPLALLGAAPAGEATDPAGHPAVADGRIGACRGPA